MAVVTTGQEGIAPAISILVKRTVLRSVSWYSKVQVPRWTPFCYVLMNKHYTENRKPSIDAAGGIHVLLLHIEFIEKGHKQVIKRFKNQKDVRMAVVNKVHKQDHHYSTLHCPT